MDDDDNIYDEIDRFNMEKDVFHETSSGKKRKRPVEVLSVNVEDESDVGEDTDFEADSDAVNEDQDIEKGWIYMVYKNRNLLEITFLFF
jgi:hypothetical protein